MLGHHRHASKKPFKWGTENGLLIVVIGSSLPSSTKNIVVKVAPPLTKLSGSDGHMCLLRLKMLECSIPLLNAAIRSSLLNAALRPSLLNAAIRPSFSNFRFSRPLCNSCVTSE